MQTVAIPESPRELLLPPEGLRARTADVLFQAVLDGAPAAIVAPRWSGVRGFFEDLAMELALGEEAVGCRTLSLGPLLRGKAPSEAWRVLLRVFGDGRDPVWPPVADERGVRISLRHTLANLPEGERRAYLFCEAQGLPFTLLREMLEEVGHAWERASVVMAVPEELPWVGDLFPVVGRLNDHSFTEATARFVEVGFDLDGAQAWALFTGGVPAFVEAALRGARPGAVPAVEAFGPLAQELRAAVQIADAQGGPRLDDVARAGVLPWDADEDAALERAGLVRVVRGQTSLRLDAVVGLLGG